MINWMICVLKKIHLPIMTEKLPVINDAAANRYMDGHEHEVCFCFSKPDRFMI